MSSGADHISRSLTAPAASSSPATDSAVQLVQQLREAGHSWPQIADVLQTREQGGSELDAYERAALSDYLRDIRGSERHSLRDQAATLPAGQFKDAVLNVVGGHVQSEDSRRQDSSGNERALLENGQHAKRSELAHAAGRGSEYAAHGVTQVEGGREQSSLERAALGRSDAAAPHNSIADRFGPHGPMLNGVERGSVHMPAGATVNPFATPVAAALGAQQAMNLAAHDRLTGTIEAEERIAMSLPALREPGPRPEQRWA